MELNKGRLIKVDNIERLKSGKTISRKQECKEYYSIHTEDISGRNEKTILLTDSEVNKLTQVHLPDFIETQLVAGRLYPFSLGKRKYQEYLLKLKYGDEYDYIVRISNRLLKKASNRAETHPSSVMKKGFFEDLFD